MVCLNFGFAQRVDVQIAYANSSWVQVFKCPQQTQIAKVISPMYFCGPHPSSSWYVQPLLSNWLICLGKKSQSCYLCVYNNVKYNTACNKCIHKPFQNLFSLLYFPSLSLNQQFTAPFIRITRYPVHSQIRSVSVASSVRQLVALHLTRARS